ncbi:fibronectin type III domain protein, partial [Tumebacillus permanentifrigoris]
MNNPGFELNVQQGDVADSWLTVPPPVANGNFKVVTTPVHEGVRAQQFAFSGLSQDQTAAIEQTFSIDPGSEYELSGYFNIQSLFHAQVQMKLDYFDVADNLVDSNVTIQTATTSGYARLQTIKVAKTNAVKCRVTVNLTATGDAGAGTFTVDQFAMRKSNAYIVNPGFETYNGMYNVADTWRVGYSPNVQTDYQVVNSPVFSGSRAQKVSASGLPNWGFAHVTQTVTAQQDVAYTVTAKLNVAELTDAKVQLYVDYFDANYEFLGFDSGEMEQTTITNGFVVLRNESTAPEHAAFLQVWALLRSTSEDGSGTFYVDDINVQASTDYPPEQPIVDLIPTMTSNTAPQGAVLVDPITNSGNAFHLFDSIGTSVGGTYVHTLPTGTIGYDFKTPTVVREYTIQPVNYLNRTPKKWTFEGFDGSDWNVLDAHSGVSDWVSNTNKTYQISNMRAYWKYRLNITENNGDPNYLYLNEVYMNGYFAKPVTPLNLSNTSNGDSKVILTWSSVIGVTSYNVYQDDKLVQIVPGNSTTATLMGLENGKVYHYRVSAENGSGESLLSKEVLAMPYVNTQWLNPIMTSNTSPLGAVTTNPSNVTAYLLFDHNDANSISLAGRKGIIEYDYQTPTRIHEYTMMPLPGYPTRMPKSWTFEGFNGTDWVVLDTQQNVTPWTVSRKYFTFQNDLVFSKYRLNITENNGDASYLTMSEIQLLGTYETPAMPKGLWNTDNGDGKVSLQWQGVNGVTEYHIYQDGELVLTT